jgi:hypothetical protein
MSTEAEIISQAIVSLKTDKDYVYPAVIALFSALVGGFVSYYSVKYSKYLDIHRNRLNVANEWVIAFQGAFETLISIKNTYAGKLCDNPLRRAVRISEVISRFEHIDLKSSDLVFLVPQSEEDKEIDGEWRKIPRITAMAKNYNFVLETWERRNKLSSLVVPKIINELGSDNVRFDQIIECVGEENFIPYIDLTEYAIKITDELLIEIHNFFLLFKYSSEEAIDTRRVSQFGSLLKYTNENEEVKVLLEKSPDVDKKLLAHIFNTEVDFIQKKYRTGYEDIEVANDPGKGADVNWNIKRYSKSQKLKSRFWRWW